MTENQKTAGGPLGKLVGKAKEVAGSAFGDDTLAREGRLQQASVDAEVVAEREKAEAKQRQAEADLEGEKVQIEAEKRRLQAEVAEDQRESMIERDRTDAERQAAVDAAAGKQRAEQAEKLAEAERTADTVELAEMRAEAARAQARAEAIDPENK